MFSLKVERVVRARAEEAWEALTDPRKSAEYFWGIAMQGDLSVGGQVVWKGEWEGKPFEDRGTIVRLERPSVFQYQYWSVSLGPDVPENRQLVTYRFAQEGEDVRVSISQDNARTKEARDHSEKNWGMLLDKLKQNLEATAKAR